jgi:hypothetical protein
MSEHIKELRGKELPKRKKKRTLPIHEKKMEISHVMFKKGTDSLRKEYWEMLNIDESYQYDCGNGFFFGSTYEDRRSAELIEHKWLAENFHKSWIRRLIRNPGVFWPVPVGNSKMKANQANVASTKGYGIPMSKLDTSFAEDIDDEMDRPKKKRRKLNLVQRAGRILSLQPDQYPVMATTNNEWPVVCYQQGKEDLCLFYSFASALRYMGLTLVASMVKDQARKSVNLGTLLERIDLLQSTLLKHREDLFDLSNRSIYSRGKFDPLNNKQKAPTLAIMRSVDGAINHAVTFFGDWIFDSNEKRALPICIEALNRVAPPGFKDVLLAFRYGKGKFENYPIHKR